MAEFETRDGELSIRSGLDTHICTSKHCELHCTTTPYEDVDTFRDHCPEYGFFIRVVRKSKEDSLLKGVQ